VKPARRSTASAPKVQPPQEVEGISDKPLDFPFRKRLARTPSRNWKRNLENNLIKAGYTPAEARKTVEIAAS
jgi:hypothetical protein